MKRKKMVYKNGDRICETEMWGGELLVYVNVDTETLEQLIKWHKKQNGNDYIATMKEPSGGCFSMGDKTTAFMVGLSVDDLATAPEAMKQICAAINKNFRGSWAASNFNPNGGPAFIALSDLFEADNMNIYEKEDCEEEEYNKMLKKVQKT